MALPLLPLVLALRYARLLPWTVEALANAEFIPQSRSTHDGTGRSTAFDSRRGSVYRPGRR